MYTLTLDEAVMLVRKNLDELQTNSSDMTDVDDLDSNNFEDALAKTLPEAINVIHNTAPAPMLEGKVLTEDQLSKLEINDDVLTVHLWEDILRMVAFQAADSNYRISMVVPEESPEGRMQKNPYTRGTSDRPRLVLRQERDYDAKDKKYGAILDYYSLDKGDTYTVKGKDDEGNDIETVDSSVISCCQYLPYYRYGQTSYDVADALLEHVINQLTGMMLIIYGETEKANIYLTMAKFE